MNHAQLAILLLIATPGLLPAAEPTDIFQANRRLGGGVNIGNYLEVPRGQGWGISIDDGHFDVIKQAGFANVRLPVRWSYWEFAAGFGVYDAKQKSWRQPLLDSLIPRSERR